MPDDEELLDEDAPPDELEELPPEDELTDEDEDVEPPDELEDELHGLDDELLDPFRPDELLELESPPRLLELDDEPSGPLLEELPSHPEDELRPLDEDGPLQPLLEEGGEPLLEEGNDPLLEDGRSDELLDGALPLLVDDGIHDELLNQPLEDISTIFLVRSTNSRIKAFATATPWNVAYCTLLNSANQSRSGFVSQKVFTTSQSRMNERCLLRSNKALFMLETPFSRGV